MDRRLNGHSNDQVHEHCFKQRQEDSALRHEYMEHVSAHPPGHKALLNVMTVKRTTHQTASV